MECTFLHFHFSCLSFSLDSLLSIFLFFPRFSFPFPQKHLLNPSLPARHVLELPTFDVLLLSSANISFVRLITHNPCHTRQKG